MLNNLQHHHYVCCMCTWWLSVSHAERRCTSDDVDRATRAAAHVLHGCRQVADLHLQLVQQSRMHMEQGFGLSVAQLQRPQLLVKGRVYTNTFFTLRQKEKVLMCSRFVLIHLTIKGTK